MKGSSDVQIVGAREADDRSLLEASRAGKGGFEAFYKRHQRAILAFHGQRVLDPEAAADLTMETFAAALAATHDPQRALPDVPVAWLFGIARRKLIDSYRRGRVEAEARQRLRMDPVVLHDDDIERVIEIASLTNLVEELERELSPDQLEALKARVLDDRDYEEIAGALECSEEVVRARVSRSLRKLRNVLEEAEDD